MIRRAIVFSPVLCPQHGNLLRINARVYLCPLCLKRFPAPQVVGAEKVLKAAA